MYKSILLIIITFLITSCAKIPVQTLDLTDAIINEGERMHQLNIKLLNKMFKDKSEKIDEFIKNEYISMYLDTFKNKIPDSIDIKTELPKILKSIIPVINTQRNKMQNALEENRIKLVTKLEQDFYVFITATDELRRLLESAIDIDRERLELFNKVKELSGKKIDLNQVESSIDDFIIHGGNVNENIINFNNSINSLINK